MVSFTFLSFVYDSINGMTGRQTESYFLHMVAMVLLVWDISILNNFFFFFCTLHRIVCMDLITGYFHI